MMHPYTGAELGIQNQIIIQVQEIVLISADPYRGAERGIGANLYRGAERSISANRYRGAGRSIGVNHYTVEVQGAV